MSSILTHKEIHRFDELESILAANVENKYFMQDPNCLPRQTTFLVFFPQFLALLAQAGVKLILLRNAGASSVD